MGFRLLDAETRHQSAPYLQMSMHQLRLACYMDSDEPSSTEALAGVVLLGLELLGNIEADRAEEDTGWSAAAGDLDAVDERCSRVEVVGGGEEEDPVGRDGDGAA